MRLKMNLNQGLHLLMIICSRPKYPTYYTAILYQDPKILQQRPEGNRLRSSQRTSSKAKKYIRYRLKKSPYPRKREQRREIQLIQAIIHKREKRK